MVTPVSWFIEHKSILGREFAHCNHHQTSSSLFIKKQRARTDTFLLARYSYRGGSWNSPSEILILSMVIIVLSQVLNNNLVLDCVRSNLRGSKFKIFLGGKPPDPPGRHTCLHVHERAFTHYYHPATILFPPSPNSKSCMKPC